MAKKGNLAIKREENGEIEQAGKVEMLGLEVFDTGDLVIPRYKIVQPTSKEGTPGVFKNNLTNEEVETVNVVVLAASKGRVCWGENLDEDPICRSSDGLRPSDNTEEPVSAICGTKENGKRFEPTCHNALWRENHERPLCNEVINLLCVSKDDQVPFFISLHGTQLKPVRAFLSALGLRKKSLYEFQATLGLKEKTNGKGKFFVIQFANLKENPPEEKEVFRAMYFQFAGHTIDQTFDAEKKMKDDLSDVPFA
jgi:hypothetical protein